MYFQSQSPAQRGSPSPQARATSLEDVAAAARATTRSRAAASASDQNGMREVAGALRDERFRAAFFRVLSNISAALARLKALHGRDFWAIHAGLMGNHRLLDSIDDLARFLDRILAKGVPRQTTAMQQRSPPTIASPEFRHTRLFAPAPPRARVPSDVAAPPPAYEEETPEQRALLDEEHAAAKQEETDSAFLLAEALAALDAAEEEHARSEEKHAATVARAMAAVTQCSDAENARLVAEHDQQQKKPEPTPEPSEDSSSEEEEEAETSSTDEDEAPDAAAKAEASPRKRMLPATPLDETRAASPAADECPGTPPVVEDEASAAPPRGLSRGVLATLQALEAASGVGVTTVTLRPAHARSARRVATN